MEKNGQISELSNDICHSDLYFFCCGANDRLGCIAPAVRFRGIFGISFIRDSINTFFI